MSIVKEKIIIGVDPGTIFMGYALIRVLDNKHLDLLTMGTIHLDKYTDQYLRLKKIFDRITSIIDEFLPDEMAIEAPFYGKNVQSMLKLGRAQGVAMTAALNRDIPIFEYAPLRVKQAVTGRGSASKEQVAEMLKYYLKIDSSTLSKNKLDASDALAVALCHHFSTNNAFSSSKRSKSWDDFIKNNPSRVNKQ